MRTDSITVILSVGSVSGMWPWARLFDAENEEKMAQHGITADQVVEILDESYHFGRNRKGRRYLPILNGG